MTRGPGILVKVSYRGSHRFGELARWLPEKTWFDKAGNEWHLLEFGDGYLCRFPWDEFEIVEELAQI